jgi:putative transposase
VRGDPPKIEGGTAVKETTVSVTQVATAPEAVLPERVQEVLGELVGAAKEGLLALSVGVGLGVMAELMQEEVDEVVGPKGKQNPARAAVRHGHEDGVVTLGGRRVWVQRPRVRSADGEREVPLGTYAHFADRDPLTRLVLEQLLAGVSTRRFARTREPVGSDVEAQARSTSKSAVSREFVARTRENLQALMSRRLDDVRLAVMMIDGIELKGRTNVVALGITTEGVKIPLGLWEGSTENATVATALLSDLVERGLDPEQGILFVIDGAKALRKAIRTVFGDRAPVQRCVRHKERNVLDHLPERDRPAVKRQLRHAWAQADHVRALDELRALASELDRSHPGATASLREGLEETLTLTCLGIAGTLKKTLTSTNPCESMVRHEAPCGRRARTINSQPCRLGCRPRADAAVR